MLTKRQAIKVVQAYANAAIEQMERQAKGWDKGIYRDDCMDRTSIHYSIRATMNRNSRYAFQVAAQFA